VLLQTIAIRRGQVALATGRAEAGARRNPGAGAPG
jgi:hypothetical protein